MAKDFNAEEVMEMSRDELIDLLGPENSALLKEGIADDSKTEKQI